MGEYYVCYDLKRGKNSPRLYYNINNVLDKLNDGTRIQQSIIMCKRKKTALVLSKLLKRYKCDNILIIEGKKLNT